MGQVLSDGIPVAELREELWLLFHLGGGRYMMS